MRKLKNDPCSHLDSIFNQYYIINTYCIQYRDSHPKLSEPLYTFEMRVHGKKDKKKQSLFRQNALHASLHGRIVIKRYNIIYHFLRKRLYVTIFNIRGKRYCSGDGNRAHSKISAPIDWSGVRSTSAIMYYKCISDARPQVVSPANTGSLPLAYILLCSFFLFFLSRFSFNFIFSPIIFTLKLFPLSRLRNRC